MKRTGCFNTRNSRKLGTLAWPMAFFLGRLPWEETCQLTTAARKMSSTCSHDNWNSRLDAAISSTTGLEDWLLEHSGLSKTWRIGLVNGVYSIFSDQVERHIYWKSSSSWHPFQNGRLECCSITEISIFKVRRENSYLSHPLAYPHLYIYNPWSSCMREWVRSTADPSKKKHVIDLAVINEIEDTAFYPINIVLS